jgi:hypothetical protein
LDVLHTIKVKYIAFFIVLSWCTWNHILKLIFYTTLIVYLEPLFKTSLLHSLWLLLTSLLNSGSKYTIKGLCNSGSQYTIKVLFYSASQAHTHPNTTPATPAQGTQDYNLTDSVRGYPIKNMSSGNKVDLASKSRGEKAAKKAAKEVEAKKAAKEAAKEVEAQKAAKEAAKEVEAKKAAKEAVDAHTPAKTRSYCQSQEPGEKQDSSVASAKSPRKNAAQKVAGEKQVASVARAKSPRKIAAPKGCILTYELAHALAIAALAIATLANSCVRPSLFPIPILDRRKTQ